MGLTRSQRELRDGLTKLFPDKVVRCSPPKHYSKMNAMERHEAAEHIRDIYRGKASTPYATDYDKAELKKYEGMGDLRVLKADEKVKLDARRETKRFLRILNEAEKRSRENPSNTLYAGLAA